MLHSAIKCLLAKAGLDPTNLSCHSLGRGGQVSLTMQEASIEEIKYRGTWSSDVVFKYIVTPRSDRILSNPYVVSVSDAF